MNYKTENFIFTGGNSTITDNTITFIPPQHIDLESAEIALNYLSIPYSWRNITSKFNNLSFSYLWNGVEFPVNIVEGFYEVGDLDLYLKFTMLANGHYLLDADGVEVYYISFTENPVYYAITFTITPVPASLPVGWTNPQGITLNGLSPQIKFDANNNFKDLLGINAGTYPAAQSASIVSFNGPNVPQISPVSSVNVSCNLCYNEHQLNSIIKSFIPTQAYGSYLNIEPRNIIFFNIPNGSYDVITISFLDQLFRPLGIIDDDIQVEILVRTLDKPNN